MVDQQLSTANLSKAITDALGEARALHKKLLTRELPQVIIKLEEAELWLTRHKNTVGED